MPRILHLNISSPCSALCDSQVPGINEIVTSLLPSLSSLHSAQRMVTAAVFAEVGNLLYLGKFS